MEKNEVLEVGSLNSLCCHLHTSRAVEVRVLRLWIFSYAWVKASIQLAVDNSCASVYAGGFGEGGRGNKAIVMNIEILC